MALSMAVASIFVACEKMHNPPNDVSESMLLQKAVERNDTIYRAACSGCKDYNTCNGPDGAGCLPPVVIRANVFTNVTNVFNNMTGNNVFDNIPIIVDNASLFAEILDAHWMEMVAAGQTSFEVEHNSSTSNRYIFRAMYIEDNGDITPAGIAFPVFID